MQWRCIDRVLQRDIPRDHNHGYPALRQRFADRDLEYPRHLVGAGDELAIVTAFLEEALWVGLLKIACSYFCRRNVCGDREYRHARAMTIEQAVDEMQIPRSAATGAHREVTGEMGLSTRCERRD